eukprot:11333337-Alexandrium_andersonii.AAC.1
MSGEHPCAPTFVCRARAGTALVICRGGRGSRSKLTRHAPHAHVTTHTATRQWMRARKETCDMLPCPHAT